METTELKQKASRSMRWLVTSLLVLLAAFALVRGYPVPLPDSSQSSAEAQIRQTLMDWVSATNAGERQRANNIWAKDLIGWYPGQPDDTYESEMQAAARPVTGKPKTTVAVTVNEVIVSGDLAVVRDTWTFTGASANPNQPDIIRSFEVWRKQSDGSWKIARWISAPEPKSH